MGRWQQRFLLRVDQSRSFIAAATFLTASCIYLLFNLSLQAVGRAIADAVAAVPTVEPAAFERGLAGNMQDLLMVVSEVAVTSFGLAGNMQDLLMVVRVGPLHRADDCCAYRPCILTLLAFAPSVLPALALSTLHCLTPEFTQAPFLPYLLPPLSPPSVSAADVPEPPDAGADEACGAHRQLDARISIRRRRCRAC